MLVGRTLAEYQAMFALDADDLNKRIFNAASGVSSVAAEATDNNITSGDIIYQFDYETLADKCSADYDKTVVEVEKKAGMFNFDFYGGLNGHLEARKQAYTKFLADYRNDRSKYIPLAFPHTNFTNDAFDLTLVSHLLFLYEEKLDYQFHKATIQELLRITRDEIRIFPLVNLTGARSAFVDKTINDKTFSECRFEIRKVDYSVFKNANEYLSIRKK